MEPLQTWWATELYPTSDEDNFGVVGNFEVVKAADAQATIAALQARVQELEQAAKETHGRFISEQAAKKDVIDELTVALKSDADGQVLIDKLMQDVLKLESQLTQRTAERDCVRRRVDELEAREVDVVLLREDLEKRTAELEALKIHCAIVEEHKVIAYKDAANLQAELEAVRVDNRTYINERHENMKQIEQLQADLAERTAELEAANHAASTHQALWREACDQRDELHAELERVRADNKALDEWRADVTVSLQRPGGAFFVDVPQHIKDLVKERDDLRTLLLALPKAAKAIQAIDLKNNNAYREQVANLQAELERVSLLSSHNERRFEMLDKKYKEFRTLLLALPKVEVVTGDTVVNIVQQYNFHQWMLRALQHRQGMEG